MTNNQTMDHCNNFKLSKLESLCLDLDKVFDENGYYIRTDNSKVHPYTNNYVVKHVKLFRTKTHDLEIGHHFLANCFKLESIDMTNVNNIIGFSDNVFEKCYKLTSIDFSNVVSNKSCNIGNAFLHGCINLTTIKLPSNVTSIGNKFLDTCSKLTTIDLTPLTNVSSIGEKFLYGCNALTVLDLSPLSNVECIGNNFLSYCENIAHIDISMLGKLKKIGDSWFLMMKKLTDIVLKNDNHTLDSLESIGTRFMYKCEKLNNFSIDGLPKLISIENEFLNCCGYMLYVEIKNCPLLCTIGMSCFCSEIRLIDISNNKSLEVIATNLFDSNYTHTINMSNLPSFRELRGYNKFYGQTEKYKGEKIIIRDPNEAMMNSEFMKNKKRIWIDNTGIENDKIITKIDTENRRFKVEYIYTNYKHDKENYINDDYLADFLYDLDVDFESLTPELYTKLLENNKIMKAFFEKIDISIVSDMDSVSIIEIMNLICNELPENEFLKQCENTHCPITQKPLKDLPALHIFVAKNKINNSMIGYDIFAYRDYFMDHTKDTFIDPTTQKQITGLPYGKSTLVEFNKYNLKCLKYFA